MPAAGSAQAFHAPRGGLYDPSELTRGPWDPDTALHDARGAIGRATQSLLIADRETS